jgi:hypothetical protein
MVTFSSFIRFRFMLVRTPLKLNGHFFDSARYGRPLVIPAKAGIQMMTGCRIESGKTTLGILPAIGNNPYMA